jgi:hypothetical protein
MVHVRSRFWAESVLGVLTSALLIITTAWPDWIERVFGVDPDGGNGAVEWAVVVVLATSTLALSLMARSEWRRARTHGSTA